MQHWQQRLSTWLHDSLYPSSKSCDSIAMHALSSSVASPLTHVIPSITVRYGPYPYRVDRDDAESRKPAKCSCYCTRTSNPYTLVRVNFV